MRKFVFILTILTFLSALTAPALAQQSVMGGQPTGVGIYTNPFVCGGVNSSSLVESMQLDSSNNLDVDLQTAIPAGANTIGAVTQASGPWTANVTQFGGTNISTGTGAGGTGIPRVTISNDSSLAANQSTNVNQIGGNAVVTGGSNGSLGVGGLAAANAAQAGDPVLAGGTYNSSEQAPTAGNVEPLQLTPSSHLKMATNDLGEKCAESTGSAGASTTATLTGVTSEFTYVSEAIISCQAAVAAGAGGAAFGGVLGANPVIEVQEETGFGFYYAQTFVPPLVSSASHTNITLNVPAITNGGICAVTLCGIIQ